MRAVRTFSIIPSLPERLKPLLEIAYNLWWTWNSDAVELFRRVNRELWREKNHNPIALLGSLKQETINELLESESFLEHLDSVTQELKEYMSEKTWYDNTINNREKFRIAYFSAEFGLHESLPMYSGGLGVLAGDHLKSASELGLPLVGVGIAYTNGYFNQILKEDGWQFERYPVNDFYNMPIQLQRRENGDVILIEVEYPEGKAYAQIWKLTVGRVPLFLLDTNIPKNPESMREISSKLYGGDIEMRIRQEILLGIGGVKALRALEIEASVFHMNEGHSAFLTFERMREFVQEKNLSFKDALEAVTMGSVFTTHTPVPAGNDRFSPELIKKYFASYKNVFGIKYEDFFGLGRENPSDIQEFFCMTVLAIRTSSYSNGVSKLHRVVSRNMWKQIWPGVPTDEIPVFSITNGIHAASWISDEIRILFNRYVGKKWQTDPADQTIWKRVENIPDAELWRGHERMRERLIGFTRKHLSKSLLNRGATASEIAVAQEVLDPKALTIVFSRRMAEYKRAYLLFMDIERLKTILNNKKCPAQIILAGKAHPHDNVGKEIIKSIITISNQPEFRRKIVFIEDYDIRVARYLVQGADVWLSTPRRPLEASGTSGMKAQFNGGINISTLDGWWCEAYNGENGWAIGSEEIFEDKNFQDHLESKALYNILEKEVIPKFYDRGSDGVPKEWGRLMKKAMTSICPVYNTNRMVKEYFEKFYFPSFQRAKNFSEDDFAKSRGLRKWKEKLRDNWSQIQVVRFDCDDKVTYSIGEDIRIQADIRLGMLSPEEVIVEAYYGELGFGQELREGASVQMSHDANQTRGDGNERLYHYFGTVRFKTSGQGGISIRVFPKNPELSSKFIPGLIHWAPSEANHNSNHSGNQ
ncbi:MAG: alpha-glucan family phosphorylase [Candidatus Aureabacteria bacterium]|nr:alpha-glucan family phosphorylase [Candidatus Auribacterota bacterium]